MFERSLGVRMEAWDSVGGLFQAEGLASAKPCDRNRLKDQEGGQNGWSE